MKTKTRVNPTAKLLAAMMTENTGASFLDSGGAYGRNHERNKDKTVETFLRAPNATADFSVVRYSASAGEKYAGKLGKFLDVSLDVFHYLNDRLELDALCNQFNRKPVKEWGDEFYGVSESGAEWIKERFEIQGAINSYNGESNLSQVIQYRQLTDKESGDPYVLMQIHGGCDVRGGYTNAKLFKISHGMARDSDSFGYEPDIQVWVTKTGEKYGDHVFEADLRYCGWTDRDGHSMTDDEMDAILPDTEEGYEAHAEAMES